MVDFYEWYCWLDCNSVLLNPYNTIVPSYYNDFWGTSNNWIPTEPNNSLGNVEPPSTYYISGCFKWELSLCNLGCRNHNANEHLHRRPPCLYFCLLSFSQSTDRLWYTFLKLLLQDRTDFRSSLVGKWQPTMRKLDEVLPNTGSLIFSTI